MSLKKESPFDIQLHLAALNGNLPLMTRILDSGRVYVDSKDNEGTTPLILTAANGHFDCVKELIEQGADPSTKRNTGTTALFFAAQGGYLDIVRFLIDHGAPIDSPSSDGGRPLFIACQCGHMSVVKELVSRGANVNAQMKDRATPLFIAAQNGYYNIVVYLLAHGAEPDTRRTDGATPLWIAAQMGHDYIVALLLKSGAFVDSARHDGATPLFKASHKGHSATITELLRYKPSLGILPNYRIMYMEWCRRHISKQIAVNGVKEELLHDMIESDDMTDFEAIVVTDIYGAMEENGESVLHAAAFTGNLSVCRQLLHAGAKPNLKNQDGFTPRDIAMQQRHNVVYDFLNQFEKKS